MKSIVYVIQFIAIVMFLSYCMEDNITLNVIQHQIMWGVVILYNSRTIDSL
jgi:hypothetical protein